MPGYKDELTAALQWRLGEAYSGKDGNKAIEWYEKALTILNEETKLREDAASAYFDVAYGLIEKKQFNEMVKLWTKAVNLRPDYTFAYYNRGLAYANLKQYDDAIADYSHAITLDPNDANAYNNRGLAYANLKQYDDAIADYSHAITLDPTYAKAYYNRGIAYANLKQYDDAIADFSHAITLDPTYALAYHNRGTAYRHLKQYDDAIADYSHALDLDPNLAQAYYNRGLAYLLQRDSLHASADYKRAYEFNPKDINAAWMAIWVGMDRQRPDEGIMAQLESIARIDEEDYVAYVCRGLVPGLRGKLKEGLAELEKAIPIKPDEWDAYFWKGMLCAYYYRGRHQMAVEAIEKALEVGIRGLPPVLLTPLYWLEADRPECFAACKERFLDKYGV